MNIRGVSYLIILALPLSLFLSAQTADNQAASEKNGTLVVLTTWDDAYKTPATGVYIEAHSFNANHVSERSFSLKMVKAGRYEAEVPPGVYDIFVSEASSIPRCRRVLVKPRGGHLWNLMLEHDDIYLER